MSSALPAGYIKTIATLIFWLLIAAERTGNEKLLNHFDVFVMWMHILKKFKEQILSPQVSMNDTVTIQIEDISVTAVRMQHGTDRSLQGIDYEDYSYYEKTENYGYLINFWQKVVFHQGDGCLKISDLAISKIKRKIQKCPVNLTNTRFHKK